MGVTQSILQWEGGEQGDPLMPMLFAPGQHAAFEAMQARLGVGYLDDFREHRAESTDQCTAGSGITTKIPPLFDGSTSLFEYEELIDNWLDLTVLEAEKRGPSLKNRLVGDAEMYKGALDCESLRAADGVKYFRDTLRPHFIKGAQSVFLWRIYQFTRARRGNVEMVKWIGKLSLLLKRLKDSWMDMSPMSALSKEQRLNQYLADVAQENAERQTRSKTALDPNAPATRERWHAAQVRNHESLFFIQ